MSDESFEGNVRYTVIESSDGSFFAVPDQDVEARLATMNEGVDGQKKHATVYSRSGLTQEEADETLREMRG